MNKNQTASLRAMEQLARYQRDQAAHALAVTAQKLAENHAEQTHLRAQLQAQNRLAQANQAGIITPHHQEIHHRNQTSLVDQHRRLRQLELELQKDLSHQTSVLAEAEINFKRHAKLKQISHDRAAEQRQSALTAEFSSQILQRAARSQAGR